MHYLNKNKCSYCGLHVGISMFVDVPTCISIIFGIPVGVTASEFRRDLWRQKTIIPGPSYGVVRDPTFNRFYGTLDL